MLAALGGTPVDAPPCGPAGSASTAFSLPEAEFVPLRLMPDRSIVGATVALEGLEAARDILSGNSVPYEQVPGCNRDSVKICPACVHGGWLGLRQLSISR